MYTKYLCRRYIPNSTRPEWTVQHAYDKSLMDATFTMFSIYMSGSRLKWQVFSNNKIMYSRSLQKKPIILYSICHGRNCDLAGISGNRKKKYRPHLAFVLLQITTLHLYCWNLQSYESIRHSLTPFLPPAITHFSNYSFIKNHKLTH